MARIELRDVTIYVQDGLAGTATLSANGTQNDTSIDIENVGQRSSSGRCPFVFGR